MGDFQVVQVISVQEANEANLSPGKTVASNMEMTPRPRNYQWWLRTAIYAFLLLSGQSVATILGRLYFEKGGKSKWMGSLVQIAGFPILLPYYCIASHKHTTTNIVTHSKLQSASVLASVYVVLGLILAAVSYLYSIGLLYLPVSTYSLISVSQLAFSAFFSFLLNSHKFTPYIVNSLVLLTISSVLLVFRGNSGGSSSEVAQEKYAAGFICTVAASAGYGFFLSLTQLAIKKVLKRETFSVVMDITVYQSLVATSATVVGLFASREWEHLRTEVCEFHLGKRAYVMILMWTAISWQVYAIGAVGLILEVSSLFSNVISVFGLAIIPVFALFFFHENMDGLMAMAMVLAIWGFISYAYQNYLDGRDSMTVKEKRKADGEARAHING